MSRTVLFLEVPSFYASVERAQDPALADRPVIVGGDPRKSGRVQAATPDAIEGGVEPEMPMAEALRLCPQARTIRTDMTLYRDVSRRLYACVRRVFPQIEVLGLAAAYLDASAVRDPDALAEALCEGVRAELGLPLRVGVARSKFLARLAAEQAGQAGVRRIGPGEETAFLHPLPVARLEGVGQKTAAVLAELGAERIGDVVALGRERLEQAFGAHGLRIFALARAEDDEPVRASRHAQTLSKQRSFGAEAVVDRAILTEALLDLARQLEEELALQGLTAGRVALQVRYADQGRQSPSQALAGAVRAAQEILAVGERLLDRTQAGSRPVRALGVQLAKLSPAAEADQQLELFSPRG
ncbi:MAG: DNA polymerase Y family protein [Myxococcota bacterium]